MKQPPDELARDLLDASEEVLLADPPPRLEDVAARVGVSRASLYYYFAGRDDLVAFLLERHAAAAGEALDTAVAETTDDDPAGRLRAALAALGGFLAAHPGMCAGVLVAAGGSGRLADALELNEVAVAGPLRALVTAATAAGGAPADPADATTAVMGAMLLAVLGRVQAGRDPTDDQFLAALVTQQLRGLGLAR